MDDPNDPVEVILAFAEHLEGSRHPKDVNFIADRDRWFVTLILSLITDPHHPVGKVITRDLFRTWMDRGGKVPIKGHLARTLRERDEFQFACQSLYDLNVSVKDIAHALMVDTRTVRDTIRWWKEGESSTDDE